MAAAKLTAPMLGGGTAAKLDSEVFGVERNDALVHQVVTSELAAKRQGTHETKTRGLVSGGRAKPWRQKGTGRARAGTTRAPQWTGGGVVFGPHPRSYTAKVNRKARMKALRIALSAHVTAKSIASVDGGTFSEPKTKAAADLVGGWREERPLVVVTTRDEDALARSFRNLERTHVVDVGALEVADLVWARSLILSKAAQSVLEGGERS
jgi:large subunit ribosomal protein L4